MRNKNPEILDPGKFLPYSIHRDLWKENGQSFRAYDRISESEKSLYLWLFYPNSSTRPFGPARFVPGNRFDSMEELEIYAESVGKKLLQVNSFALFAEGKHPLQVNSFAFC